MKNKTTYLDSRTPEERKADSKIKAETTTSELSLKEKIIEILKEFNWASTDLDSDNQFSTIEAKADAQIETEKEYADKILKVCQEKEKETLEEYKKAKSKIDKPAFGLLYGMKLREVSFLPKDEIWIATDKQKVRIWKKKP